jgi:hypothetical protein
MIPPMGDFLNSLEQTTLASMVRGDTGLEWLFPQVEIVHVLALALVFGSILMVDLRLLGLNSRASAVSRLSAEVLPWTWGAFAVAALSGGVLFISKAHTYFYNLPFRLKFLCMALAGINMLCFHFGDYRKVARWDLRSPPPVGARIAGLLSVLLWVGVIFCGRWIGFTT